ncbi:unnamed protein product, partial [Amoebophrya sp. A25]|eukprot:GSA25T00007122001.1
MIPARGGGRNQRGQNIARVAEHQIHSHLDEQVQARKLRKLEDELKEAKAVHKELTQQHEMGDFEALGLAEQKQKHIRQLEGKVAEMSVGVASKPVVVPAAIRLGPQEKNLEGAPRAFKGGADLSIDDTEARKAAVYDFVAPGKEPSLKKEKENLPPWLQGPGGGGDLFSAPPGPPGANNNFLGGGPGVKNDGADDPFQGGVAKKTREQRLAERQRERQHQQGGTNL